MPTLEGSEVALARQVNTEFKDSAWTRPSFLGKMVALDTYYNREFDASFKPVGIDGGEMQVNFWRGNPVTEGVDPFNPDYNARRLNIAKNHRHIAGKMAASWYQGGEPVDKAEVRALKNDQQMADLVLRVAKAAKNSILTDYNDDLFPAVNQVGGDAATGKAAKDRMMAFAYPLQSGYADNEATGSGTYTYFGIDLNVESELKAVNVGTTSSAFTCSPENLEEHILMPLREERGANVDIMMMGKDIFIPFKALAEEKQGNWPHKLNKAPFGSTSFMWQDIVVCYEPRMDLLPVEEVYIGDSSTLRFGGDFGRDDYIDVIQTWQEMPSAHLIQWFLGGVFFNENPRFWGRVYNAAAPS